MAKSGNQKQKLLYLYKILFENTDEEHPMTLADFIQELGRYGISAERKSLYADLQLLSDMGVDVVSEKRERFVYYIGQRRFQTAELKLLVDCIQASKFITPKKSMELIGKLEGLTSRHLAGQLRRQVYIADRVKAFNETIYYNVDFLHHAVSNCRKVRFHYYQYITGRLKKLKNDGAFYTVSPYGLVYSDDNYYLVGHYPKHAGLSHFRVDRMADIAVLEERAERPDTAVGGAFNMAEYTKKLFGMYHGETQMVQLLCPERLLHVVIDKFGEDVFLRAEADGNFIATVRVDVSPAFFGWLMTLGDAVRILSPPSVVQQWQAQLRCILKLYND